MRYSHVLLDLDHTLLDSDTSLELAFADAMAAAGADGDGHYPRFDGINRTLWRAVERGELTPPQVHLLRFERLIEALDLEGTPQAMADAFAAGLGSHGELYAGARELLDALADRAVLALVTNGLSDVQRARIDRLGIAGYFETIVISAEVGTAKPHPDIFELTFAAIGHPGKDRALMVGDNLSSDIAGGNGYGIATCWYNPARLPHDPAHPATHEIEHLGDLVPVVHHA